jgi:hypothetical protein
VEAARRAVDGSSRECGGETVPRSAGEFSKVYDKSMVSPARLFTVLAVVMLPSSSVLVAQQHPAMPPGMTHDEHMAQMKKEAELKKHGEMAMGFDQDKATHHFVLSATGGSIAVAANDPADRLTRDQVRHHLQEIAKSFAAGDFEKPLMTHGEMPSGVSGMQRHKQDIHYTFESSDRGGVVRIMTSNADAVDAIHDFLRYQIRAHATGDPLTVQK